MAAIHVAALLSHPAVRGAIERALAARGVRGDTMIAHIDPREAAMLRFMGGVGTVNPRTGLRQFYNEGMSPPGTDTTTSSPGATVTSPMGNGFTNWMGTPVGGTSMGIGAQQMGIGAPMGGSPMGGGFTNWMGAPVSGPTGGGFTNWMGTSAGGPMAVNPIAGNPMISSPLGSPAVTSPGGSGMGMPSGMPMPMPSALAPGMTIPSPIGGMPNGLLGGQIPGYSAGGTGGGPVPPGLATFFRRPGFGS